MMVPGFYAASALQIPGGDMAVRFGNNMTIGGGFRWKTKANWTLSLEGAYLFGGTIHESGILDGLKDDFGNVINSYGELATVKMFERGYHTSGRVGRIINLPGSNANSGLWVELGAGFLEHWIRIENPGNNIPQLMGDYRKGYDRRSNGLALTQFIGYSHLSANQRTNFFFGIEFCQAFTQNRRNTNFDTGLKDTKGRRDFFYGLKIGWVFPIYRQTASEYFTY